MEVIVEVVDDRDQSNVLVLHTFVLSFSRSIAITLQNNPALKHNVVPFKFGSNLMLGLPYRQ